MKRILIRLIVAALAVATVAALVSCDQWKTPYESLEKDGYNVVVRFDAGDGVFVNTNNVFVVDTFKMTDFQKNSDGYHEIPLLPPDSSLRDREYSVSNSGYTFAGWYTQRDKRVDTEGNMLDDYGNITTDPDKQGYIYSGLWNFESDTLKIDPSNPPTINETFVTLYAAWVPGFNYEFYVSGESEPYDTDTAINLQLPCWKNGKQDLRDMPGIDGKSFTGAYYDPDCTQPITDNITGQIDYEHGVILTPVIKVYTTWRDGEWYRIEKLDQFTKYASENGCYELMCDLDFQGKSWPKVFQSNGFNGTIIGGGHTIKNLTVIQADNSQTHGGIFKSIGDSAVIKDLTFENAVYTISAGSRKNGAIFGTLAAQASDQATFENVTFNATLEILKNNASSLSESKNHVVGLITGNGNIEGLLGTVVCYFVDGENRTPITPNDSGMIDISELPTN